MRIKRVELILMAPGNTHVLRTFRIKAGPRKVFTPAGAEQCLDNMIARIDEANPNHKWRLVPLGNYSFKLVWEDSPLSVPEQAHKFITNQSNDNCAVCGLPHRERP